MFKKILLSVFIIFPVFFLVSFVSGKWLVLSGDIEGKGILSKNVYLEDADLKKTVVYYDSEQDLSSMALSSNCNTQAKFLSSQGKRYYFQIEYLDENCRNGNVFLREENVVLGDSMLDLKIFDYAQFFIKITDYSDTTLNKLAQKLNDRVQNYKVFSKYHAEQGIDHFEFFKKNRAYRESLYLLELIVSIQEGRNKKYLVPVPGYDLPTNLSKIPNAGRPYRQKYTDGVHHSWDINAPFGEKVIALDDGVIVRVVDDWDWSDFAKLRFSENMSYEDTLRNLDIYRGNQVWIKTRKGDVVFYNHLNEVSSYIQEGNVVKAGTLLGTIGITGVPDKNYDDYHLDFSIHKNPYNHSQAGNYDIVDYMSWDREFRGKSAEYILKHQNEIFGG